MGFNLKSGNASAFKMMGSSSPAKQKAKVDPDAPGTPGEPGYEPEVKSMDYLTKTPVGPRVTEKEKKDRENKARQEREKANRFEHNVDAKMDEYPPKYFHEDIKRKNQ